MSRRGTSRLGLGALVLWAGACAGSDDASVVLLAVSASHRLDLEGYDGSIIDLVVGPDGVWGLFEAEPLVRFLPTSREVTPTLFGREGMGPGELGWPRAVARQRTAEGSGEGVIVLDPARGAILTFDRSGSHVSTLAGAYEGNGPIRRIVARLTYGRPFQMRAAPGGLVAALYPEGVNLPGDLRHGELVWIDARSGERQRLLDLGALVSDHGESRVLPQLPLWDVCGEELVVYDPDASQLLFLEIGGRARRIRAIDWPVRELRPEEIHNYLRHALLVEAGGRVEVEELEVMLNQTYRRTRHLFPEFAPRFARLLCGAEGVVWIQTFDAGQHPLGHGLRWLGLGPGGAVAELALPNGFRPYRFEANRVLGLKEEPSGDLRPFIMEFAPALTQPTFKEPVQ